MKKEHKADEKIPPEKTPSQPGADGQVSVPREEYDALQQKARESQEHYERYLRAHADYDNARKRFQKEKTDAVKYAQHDVLLDLLPIAENFDRAYAAAQKDPAGASLKEGVALIAKELAAFLRRFGVEKIDAVNVPFNHDEHEAVSSVCDRARPDGVVVEILHGGYKINGITRKPAMVIINKYDDQTAQTGGEPASQQIEEL